MDKKFNRAAIAGSALFHLCILFWLGTIKQSPMPPPDQATERKRTITHLVDPPTALTQRARNKAPLSKELFAEAILPRPQVRKPAPPPSPTPAREAAKPQAIPEPPRIQIATAEKAPIPQATPPPPPQVEKPKLTFENVQQPPAPVAKTNANPALASQNPIQEAIRNVARTGASGSQAVGDASAEADNTGPGLNLPPSAGRPRSSLELKSDPMGVDFKPYLVRVLATVRRNWFAIYPEAARLGQRGRVLVEFAVAPDGTITKVVFSQQSGSRPLDEAAVAALSASNRLPPLPADFKGSRVVLQFTFSYNMAVR